MPKEEKIIIQVGSPIAQVSRLGEIGRTIVGNLECETCLMTIGMIKDNFCYTNCTYLPYYSQKLGSLFYD